MSSGKAPPAPDYRGAAEATAESNQAVNAEQTWANRPNITTPWGSQTWSAASTVDPSTGRPVTQWNQNIQLSPQQQEALDSQMAIQNARSGAAQSLLPGALGNLGLSFGSSGAPPSMQGVFSGAAPWASGVSPTTSSSGPAFGGSPTVPVAAPSPATGSGSRDWRAAAQGAVLGFQQPIQIQRQQQLEAQLSNMGVTRGSAAWRNASRDLQDQNARENLLAFGAGQQEASLAGNVNAQQQTITNATQQQAFQQQMQAQAFQNQVRQQQIAESLMGRTQGINELNALLSGSQIGMPAGFGGASQAGRASGVDYTGVAQNQYGSDLNAANIANQAAASNTQAGLSLAGTAAMMFMFSDARLKQDIKPLFTLPNGVEICSYRFIGSDKYELGVIAQQVQSVMGDAVAADANGVLKVDYNKVLA